MQNASLLSEGVSFSTPHSGHPSTLICLSALDKFSPSLSVNLQHSKCKRTCMVRHLFLGRYLEESSNADDIVEALKNHWNMEASPLGGELHMVEAESKAPSRLGTRSTAQATQTSGLCFSMYPCETVSKLGAIKICFLIPDRNDPQFSKREGNAERQHLTSVSYIHHWFWICTRSLGRKKKKKHQL